MWWLCGRARETSLNSDMLSGEIRLVLAQLKEDNLYSYVGSEQIISKTGIKDEQYQHLFEMQRNTK